MLTSVYVCATHDDGDMDLHSVWDALWMLRMICCCNGTRLLGMTDGAAFGDMGAAPAAPQCRLQALPHHLSEHAVVDSAWANASHRLAVGIW